MRLTTGNGALDMPDDFSLTIERANPLLTNEGDVSAATTLPATPRNLAALGHRERLDRALRYTDRVEAILQVGPLQRRGSIVIGSVSRDDGIEAAFALDNGDLYATSKDKALKDIMRGKKEAFGSVRAAVDTMQAAYEGRLADADYAVLPVAVAPYEEDLQGDKQTVYQYNNEVAYGTNTLVWEARTVHEGDISRMAVPDGYGIAPFLKLHRVIALLFEQMGYTVERNDFAESLYWSEIVLAHNCSDCLCNPTATLYYSDLVPSCTLGEFVTWLADKFHAAVVADSEARRVRVVLMENTLLDGADESIDGLVEGCWTVRHNASRRVVLVPNNKIDGTAPAADTFDKLIERYGGYRKATEPQFHTLGTERPALADCLVMRMATGQFYLLGRDADNSQTVRLLGTNHFRYDRANADEAEEHSPADVMPLMLCGLVKPGQTYDVVPYIGDRIHAHTTHSGSDKADTRQDIIVLVARTSALLHYTTTGTCQGQLPYTNGQSLNLYIDLSPYGLYRSAWHRWNTLLRNHATHAVATLRLGIGQVLGMDMAALKLCDGQLLLPVAAKAAIGSRMGPTEAEFVIARRYEDYADGVEDQPIKPSDDTRLRWEAENNAAQVAQRLFRQFAQETEDFWYESYPTVTNVAVECLSHTVAYTGTQPIPGTPTFEGETKIFQQAATITLETRVTVTFMGGQTSILVRRPVYENQTVTVIYTAVAA